MDQARQILMQYSGPYAYLAFYCLIMSCGIGVPMNSDFCLITASVLAALGVFNLKILIPIAFCALLTGDSITFFVGRKWGRHILAAKPVCWVLSPKKVELAEHYLNTKGTKFLFIVRFLPLIRTVLFFTAGSLRVRPRTFYLMDMAATAIYLPIVMGGSFYASENIDQVVETLKKFQFGLLALVLASGLFFFFRWKSNPSNKADRA